MSVEIVTPSLAEQIALVNRLINTRATTLRLIRQDGTAIPCATLRERLALEAIRRRLAASQDPAADELVVTLACGTRRIETRHEHVHLLTGEPFALDHLLGLVEHNTRLVIGGAVDDLMRRARE